MAAGDTNLTMIGNLVNDPELRFTPSGAAVAKFTVAGPGPAAGGTSTAQGLQGGVAAGGGGQGLVPAAGVQGAGLDPTNTRGWQCSGADHPLSQPSI